MVEVLFCHLAALISLVTGCGKLALIGLKETVLTIFIIKSPDLLLIGNHFNIHI